MAGSSSPWFPTAFKMKFQMPNELPSTLPLHPHNPAHSTLATLAIFYFLEKPSQPAHPFPFTGVISLLKAKGLSSSPV